MSQPPKQSTSSYDAFHKVDELVAKPVLGSDGAAQWQDFQKSNGKRKAKPSVAPKAPLKAADRAAGFTSWEQERDNERHVRETAGDQHLGAGYTTFRTRPDEEPQNMTKKQRKLIEQKIRHEDQPYFIPATTFQGWKKDYIFTTRDRGTGYYWDGTDSCHELHGQALPQPTSTATTEESTGERLTTKEPAETETAESEPTQRKKRNKEGPVIISDPCNPREQVATLLAKYRQPCWEQAVDSTTNRVYYFHRTTGERSWTHPELPTGWQSALSADGKTYYYHTETGETRWERPTAT